VHGRLPGSGLPPGTSIGGLPIGVPVGGAFEDQRRGLDLGLGRLQDRAIGRSGPGRERRAELPVVRVLGRDQQALPVREPVGERAVRGSQVLDPLAISLGGSPGAGVSSSR
jgi:hypothetical protein